MKRSEAINKLMGKVIFPFEVIRYDNYESGEYQRRAERLLDFIEKELGMLPPRHYSVPDEVKEEPHMPGYHGLNGWEPEDG